MKNKDLYIPPVTETFPVVQEVNFCESVNGGAGTPDYTKDDYTPIWG